MTRIRTPRDWNRSAPNRRNWEDLERWAGDVNKHLDDSSRSLADMARELERVTERAITVTGVANHASQHGANRSDPLPTAAPGQITPDDVAAIGGSNAYSRADHTHGITMGTPVALGAAAAEGSADFFARSDHIHPYTDRLAASGDTWTLTSDGTDLTFTSTGEDSSFVDGVGGTMVRQFSTANSNRGQWVNGHLLLGQGTSKGGSPSGTDPDPLYIVEIAEEWGAVPWSNALRIAPIIDSDMAGASAYGALYAIEVTSGFNNPGALYGHAVQIAGTSTTPALASALTVTGLYVKVNPNFPAGSASPSALRLIHIDTSTLSNATPTVSFGIDVASAGGGTTAWAARFAGAVAVNGQNELGVGGINLSLATKFSKSIRSATNTTGPFVFKVDSSDVAKLGNSAVNNAADLYLRDGGSASEFYTKVRAVSSTAYAADHLLTVDMDGADRTLDFGDGIGNVTSDISTSADGSLAVYNSFDGRHIDQLTGTRGDVLIHNATAWAALAAGVSGYVLTSNGPAVEPSWESPVGKGIYVDASEALGSYVDFVSSAPTSSYRYINWVDTYVPSPGYTKIEGRITLPINSDEGGTGLAVTYAVGDMLYAAFAVAGQPLARLTIGSSTDFLTVSSGIPAWSTINALTADASPVAGTDYVMTWDADASTHKKVLLSSLTSAGAMSMGELSITDNATATVISTGDTATLFDETTTLNVNDDFDSPSAGRLRYIGTDTKTIHCGCTISVKGAGANDVFEAVLIKNATVNGSKEYSTGTILTQGQTVQKLGAVGDVASTAIHVMVEMATNDYLELFVKNVTDTDNVTVTDMNLFAVGMPSSSAQISNGDKGDITVSGSGNTWTIDSDVVTYAKMQNVSATSRLLGRKTAGAGDPEECTLSEALDMIGSAAQGDILYRGASTWARLAGLVSANAKTLLQFNSSTDAPEWAQVEYSKTIVVEDPGGAEDLTIFYTDGEKIEITEIRGVITGSITTVTCDVKYGTDRSAAGTSCLSSAVAVTSTTSGTTGSLTSPCTINTGNWVWLETSAGGGTGTLAINITYERRF